MWEHMTKTEGDGFSFNEHIQKQLISPRYKEFMTGGARGKVS